MAIVNLSKALVERMEIGPENCGANLLPLGCIFVMYSSMKSITMRNFTDDVSTSLNNIVKRRSPGLRKSLSRPKVITASFVEKYKFGM